jgi:hypothetical protein
MVKLELADYTLMQRVCGEFFFSLVKNQFSVSVEALRQFVKCDTEKALDARIARTTFDFVQ